MRNLILLSAIVLAACAGPQQTRLEELAPRGISQCGIRQYSRAHGIDVAIAFDASRSTAAASRTDIDSDGTIGARVDSVMTDPDDSLLAAEVSGLRSLLHAARGSDTRFSIVSFTGRTYYPINAPPQGIVFTSQARRLVGLTSDLHTLEVGLERALGRGSSGNTDFAAGMQQALRTLSADEPEKPRRRIMLFISESPTPVLAGPSSHRIRRRDPLMKTAALAAIDEHVRIYTFGLGEAAAASPPHALSRIAGSTGGLFRAVDDAAMLHCHLLRAVLPRSRRSDESAPWP